MKVNVNGIKTQRDDASIFFDEADMKSMQNDFGNLSCDELKQKYGFNDVRDWQVQTAKDDLISNVILAKHITYRPFDKRYMLYTGKTKGIQGYPRYDKMRHLLNDNNFALVIGPQGQAVGSMLWNLVFVSELIVDTNVYYRGGGIVFPLYLYPEENTFETERRANLDETIWARINTAIGREATPEQIFDYIYGVLHSPRYRERYREFLKVDFPRIPYPANAKEFERYAAFGTRLRQLHLMHNLPAPQVTFPESGTLAVEKAEYRQGRVYINATQYFDGVPESAWNFYIGGYQPAQKWLKDRKTRTLSFEDVRHYQQIIYVLQETEKIMSEIDEE